MSKKNGLKNKAIKYRIYPTAEQKQFILFNVGCCRKVWNLMLNDKIDYYKENKLILNNTPSMYKSLFSFLKEADSSSLANVQINLNTAYKSFFKKKSKFPKYKSKKYSRTSYTTSCINNNIEVLDDYIKLPKLGKVKAIIHRNCPDGYILKSATVSMEKDLTFYCSLLYEYEKEELNYQINIKNSIGLDYKSDGFYVDSNSDTLGSPKYFRKSQDKLAKEQKKLSKIFR